MGRKKPRPLPEDLGLPLGGADSHAHLNMGNLSGNLDRVLTRAQDCGVSLLGNVFLGPEAYDREHGLFGNYSQVFFIIGVHPHEAREFTARTGQELNRIAENDPRVKAVGETGLDFFYDHSPRSSQEKAFKAQLDLAKELDLPVVIHSRDAFEQTINILTRSGFKDRPLLWHCFGLGPEEAKKILSSGWHISVPGSVTFNKSLALQQAVKIIPEDRLLIETDCPFLTPEPYRGKTNEPALLGFTALKIAQVKGIDVDEVWLKCGDNCRKFFNVDQPQNTAGQPGI
ncbi:TatD family hydrolase [Desulfonatronovibrio hydrogenovorans]|uniref:TatD family hydrolase n=1 Tax=Desulfonatronovibrio hydrogenovorans TaxID=53245 RepID=UPI00048E8074|nr:TatD family hydrolase [Desulfonatronovibrio hydrogenovorans]